MAIRGLAEYLAVKYARNNVFAAEAENDSLPDPNAPKTYQEIVGPADTSLGAPVHPSMAQRYKDKLVAVYDRIKQELTQIPFFQQLYVDMQDEPVLMAFNSIIDAYTASIGAASTLKDAFLFGIKYVEAFNGLRDKLPSLVKDREKLHRIDEAIYNTQMYMWSKLKAMLDLHKIGSGILPLNQQDSEEMQKILKQMPRGTWHYGPMKNPTKGMFKKVKTDNARSFKNRMEDEILKDEIRKRLGPYATENEVLFELENVKDQDKKRRQDASKLKYEQNLFGKEKNKLR